jgi:hypothetical protein
VKEALTDDANRFARRGVNKEGRIGVTKHDDAGAGIQKQFDGAPRPG